MMMVRATTRLSSAGIAVPPRPGRQGPRPCPSRRGARPAGSCPAPPCPGLQPRKAPSPPRPCCACSALCVQRWPVRQAQPLRRTHRRATGSATTVRSQGGAADEALSRLHEPGRDRPRVQCRCLRCPECRPDRRLDRAEPGPPLAGRLPARRALWPDPGRAGRHLPAGGALRPHLHPRRLWRRFSAADFSSWPRPWSRPATTAIVVDYALCPS